MPKNKTKKKPALLRQPTHPSPSPTLSSFPPLPLSFVARMRSLMRRAVRFINVVEGRLGKAWTVFYMEGVRGRMLVEGVDGRMELG
ncbi:hypothetical protein ACLMJK_000899 [Lecanora helva]